jgi:hypothetical protein
MDNLGVRLPVDATAKSKFKSERPHESYEKKMTVGSRKPAGDAWLSERYRTARLKGQVILLVCARIQQI